MIQKTLCSAVALIAAIGFAFVTQPSVAVALDPCGMVPPIYTGPGVPIVRTGLQKTYVFYKDGIETFVIRPGFQGRVENFGMLIPFPNPPALRKVPDNIFEQIDNAIDPPEVVIDLNPMRFRGLMSKSKKSGEKDGDDMMLMNNLSRDNRCRAQRRSRWHVRSRCACSRKCSGTQEMANG